MVAAAKARGYAYYAITDHSHYLREGRMEQQAKEIDKLAKKVAPLKLLKGVEVNIKADGTLDVPDEVLAERDWVVASIHTAFDRSPTERVLATMENPHVDVIGHLTGRKIKRREPMEIDLERVVEKALETGTFLEINSQPDRLDLRDVNARLAGEAGVKIVISSDAHQVGALDYVDFGVAQARRAWLHRRAGREHAHLGTAEEADEEVTPRRYRAVVFDLWNTIAEWPTRSGRRFARGSRSGWGSARGVRRALVRRARANPRDRPDRRRARALRPLARGRRGGARAAGASRAGASCRFRARPRRSPSCASAGSRPA